jgi:hypothetical protein
MNKKEVFEIIKTSLNDGKSHEQIFKELTQSYHDKNMLVKLIAMFPTNERKEKYRRLNYVLFSFLILTAVLKVLTSLSLLLSISPYSLLLIFFIPLINVWLAIEVWKMRGYIYRIIGLLGISGICLSLQNSFPTEGSVNFSIIATQFLIIILIFGPIIFLGFYLGKKMFPNYGLMGPKKDTNGNYVF